MRLRTAVIVSTSVITVGGLGITVASGATPIWKADDLPAPNLTLDCPETLELGDAGSLAGTLQDETGKSIGKHDVTVTRDDEFAGATIVGTVQTAANDGSFDGLSDTPVNRGIQDYEVTFAATDAYAEAKGQCTTDVHGTDTTLTAAGPTGVATGDRVEVTGQLETAAGDPVSEAPITAIDNLDGTTTTLEEATTDADGGYTVTVPSITTGEHKIDIEFHGDEVLEPTTHQFEVTAQQDGTSLTVDPVNQRFAGEDIAVGGTLTTASGDPLSDAPITATDTVGGTTTDLTDTTTDSEGGFTVTVPSAEPGEHRVDISYAGQGPNKAATGQVEFETRYETKLTLTGPDSLPAEPGPMTFTITLTDGAGAAMANAEVKLDDGGDWQRITNTDENGQARLTRFKVSNEKPLRIEVTYAGDSTHWESSKARTWKATPQYMFKQDKAQYVAGDEASFSVTTPDQTLPTTITLKPHGRPAISITPSSDSNETAFTRKVMRNSTLTVSTEATGEYEAGTAEYPIRVAPQINQTLQGWYDQSGDTYLVRTSRDPRLTAKVIPSRPGRCVKAKVQKLIDGVYQTVQTSTCRLLNVDSETSFTLVKNPRPGARFRMRFESPADDMNIAGHGSWTNIRFTT
jgi:5-hydroxyisourate hydrolase-like protein (transthyretin family)